MELSSWKKNKMSSSGCMLRVDKKEALAIIKSLSSQLFNDNPNTGREEFLTEKGEYFSIVVSEKPKYKSKELEISHIYENINMSSKYHLNNESFCNE